MIRFHNYFKMIKTKSNDCFIILNIIKQTLLFLIMYICLSRKLLLVAFCFASFTLTSFFPKKNNFWEHSIDNI